MNYESGRSWSVHPALPSNHIINCARCKRTTYEAGIVEAYTYRGEIHIAICSYCLADFIYFTRGEPMPTDCEFSEEALALAGDIDIAEHHALCQCYECLVDPDHYYKFERENSDITYNYQERSA